MATIIKRTAARNPRSASFNFADMTHEANSYLDEVRVQAEKIVSDARVEADAIRTRAEAEGRDAAHRAAEERIEQRISQTLLPALESVGRELEIARQSCVSQWQKQLVHLAAAIAEKVIRRDIAKQPEITLELVSETLQLATGSPQLTVRLSPQDFESLGEHVAGLSEQMSAVGETRVLADPAITPGGCRVDTEHGVIDQRIESQLARIEEELS